MNSEEITCWFSSSPACVPASTPILLLAGGKGTRLRASSNSILRTTAKLLVPVQRNDEQMPMIGIALARLSVLGYRNVSLLTSQDPKAAGAAIEAYAVSAFGSHLALTVYRERYPLGTAGAVYAALQHVQNDSIAVVPGDTLFPFETLSDALAAHDWGTRKVTWLVTTRTRSSGAERRCADRRPTDALHCLRA